MTKLLAKAETAESADAASKQLCEDSLEKMRRWGAAAKAAINLQDSNKSLPADAEQVPLTELPFDSSDLKVLLQQSSAGQKSLRESLPKPAAKAKGNPAGDGVEKLPKRRRVKAPE